MDDLQARVDSLREKARLLILEAEELGRELLYDSLSLAEASALRAVVKSVPVNRKGSGIPEGYVSNPELKKVLVEQMEKYKQAYRIADLLALPWANGFSRQEVWAELVTNGEFEVNHRGWWSLKPSRI